MWLGPRSQTEYMFFFISDCCSYMSQENNRIEELCLDRFNIWNPSIILVWSGNTVLVSCWQFELLLLCAEHTLSSSHPAHVFEISSIQTLCTLWHKVTLSCGTHICCGQFYSDTNNAVVFIVVNTNKQVPLIMANNNLQDF